MKEIFRFFHKCFFALQKFKSFFILSIFFDALLQGIKLIEPWILASMLDSLYKNSKDVFLQKVATLSLIIIMQITLSYIFIRLKSYVTRGVNAVCKKNIYSKIADVPPTLLSDYSTGNLINVTLDDSAHIVDYCYTLCSSGISANRAVFFSPSVSSSSSSVVVNAARLSRLNFSSRAARVI